MHHMVSRSTPSSTRNVGSNLSLGTIREWDGEGYPNITAVPTRPAHVVIDEILGRYNGLLQIPFEGTIFESVLQDFEDVPPNPQV